METKKLFSISKSKLCEMCYPVPENVVRKNINQIVFENRKNRRENLERNFTQIVSGHYLEKKEIKEFFDTYGYPEGVEI